MVDGAGPPLPVPVPQGRTREIAQHDLICREAAPLSRSVLLAEQAFTRSARANLAGILHANSHSAGVVDQIGRGRTKHNYHILGRCLGSVHHSKHLARARTAARQVLTDPRNRLHVYDGRFLRRLPITVELQAHFQKGLEHNSRNFL